MNSLVFIVSIFLKANFLFLLLGINIQLIFLSLLSEYPKHSCFTVHTMLILFLLTSVKSNELFFLFSKKGLILPNGMTDIKSSCLFTFY